MSRKSRSFQYRALFLSVAAVAGTGSFAHAGLTVTGIAGTLPASWPNDLTGVPPVIVSGSGGAAGSPNTEASGSNDTVIGGFIEAESFTPTSNFNLGAIDMIFSGGGNDNFTFALFQMNSNITGATTGYILADDEAAGVGDLLGGGAGLGFHYNGSGASLRQFTFTNTGTNDNVALSAGVTYMLEMWETDPENASGTQPGANSVFISRTPGSTPQPYAGGQVYTNQGEASDAQEPFSPEVRGMDLPTPANLLFAVYPTMTATNGNWIGTVSGSWTNSANWSNGAIPHVAGDSAVFGTTITSPAIVTLDATETVGAIAFNSTNSYTIAPGTGGSLVLDNGGTGTTATVINSGTGNHTISAPIFMNAVGVFSSTTPAGTLTISGNLSGNTFTASGAGTVVLSGVNTYGGGGTQVLGGTLQLGSNGAISTATSVNIATNAKLDLNGFSPTSNTLFGDGVIDDLAGGGNSVYTNGGTGNSTFSGSIRNSTGTVGINFVGAGTLTLAPRSTGNGANTYSGTTTITSGAVVIGNSLGLPTGGKVVNNSLFAALNGSTPIVAGNISGSGMLQVGNGSTAGFLQLASGSGADTQGMVSVASGSTLDITNNKVVINFGSPANDPISSIVAAITSGAANNGSQNLWTGTGITSSTAATSNGKFSIGYLDGNLASDNTTNNPISQNQIILKYTLTGDAFLEGTVGFDDLLTVAQNYGASSGRDWAQGSFDYTGAVGFGDLLSVAQSYGSNSGVSQGSVGSGVLSLAWQSAPAAAPVPEPTGIALVGVVGGLLARRRRSRTA